MATNLGEAPYYQDGTGKNQPAIGVFGQVTSSAPVNSVDAQGRAYGADPIWRPAAYSFTRPANATAYTAPTTTTPGQMIANATAFGSVVPMSFVVPPFVVTDTPKGLITEFQLDYPTPVTGTVRVEFFRVAPTLTVGGDGSAYAYATPTSLNDRLGYVDIALTPNGRGGSSGGSDSIRLAYHGAAPGDMTLYALLSSQTALASTIGGTITGKPTVLRTT